VLAVAAWTGVAMFIIFSVLKATVGLRVSVEDEKEGLDISEHALESSYADFMPLTTEGLNFISAAKAGAIGAESPAATSVSGASGGSGAKLTKVEVYTDPRKLDELKDALNSIGITGLTVSPVSGYGAKKAKSGFYRGAHLELPLLPKVKVETVVSKVPVEAVVGAVKSALYTGAPGDGKIFIYSVDNVVRVSTGEEGYDALQYDYDRANAKA
jgi:Amt family ammonium transporter